MVRWRYFLVLAVLLLLPTKIGTKDEDEDDDSPKPVTRRGAGSEESAEDDDDDDDDDDEEETEKPVERTMAIPGRRAMPPILLPTSKTVDTITRSPKKRPLECYVCAFRADTPLRACLDPTKFRVHTITCHSVEDKCFTSVISKGNVYEAVVRGCRSSCVGSPETTCCELNRCNNQAFAMPFIIPRALPENKATSLSPPNVLFFVTILLLLQTVVKVAFV